MRSAIVLAAGKGTRMHSDKSKVLHTIIDRPMLAYSIDALQKAGAERIVVVVGYQGQAVIDAFPGLEYAWQIPQNGSGHAAMQCTMLAHEDGETLVINGDGPCIQPETLEKLYQANEEASMTLLSSIVEDGAHYGRVLRDENGNVTAIREAKDCTASERQVREINAGMYCFKTKDLFEGLKELKADNAQHEYYITDLAEILAGKGKKVQAMQAGDPDELMGINDPAELARAAGWIRNRINEAWMKKGVLIDDPARAVIGPDVILGQNVHIGPDVEILGSSEVEDGASILSGSRLVNAHVGKNAVIDAGRVYNTSVEEEETVGPYTCITKV